MARASSAVLKGSTSKKVKAAGKLKTLKADLKSALKEQALAVKALDKADNRVAALQLKLAKLETPSEVTEQPVIEAVELKAAA